MAFQRTSAGSRRELLQVLMSSSLVRADVIRQFHEAGRADMAELLMLIEEREWARLIAIEELSRG